MTAGGTGTGPRWRSRPGTGARPRWRIRPGTDGTHPPSRSRPGTGWPAALRRPDGQRRAPGARAPDPFAALELDPGAELTDDEVRAAWRRLAAATHPDRADGGDPERFAAAAAAYTELRTPFGRGEARAGLAARGEARAAPAARSRTGPAAPRSPAALRPWLASLPARVSGGRPGRLAVRVVAAAAAAALAVLAAWPRPAAAGLLAGIATWLVLTGRQDLAPWSGGP